MGATRSRCVGLLVAAVHCLGFAATVAHVSTSDEEQSSLLWLVWLIVDAPLSILVIALAKPYQSLFGPFGDLADSPLAWLLYPPYLVHGIVGAIWWYFLASFAARKLQRA